MGSFYKAAILFFLQKEKTFIAKLRFAPGLSQGRVRGFAVKVLFDSFSFQEKEWLPYFQSLGLRP
ncbi:MAG: hypothetical protein HFF80_05950 [Oscillospiraceae bacterium]|jgi:hypothetical protein|nr:hypothetical protein [Oscillospiraceae bacterium]